MTAPASPLLTDAQAADIIASAKVSANRAVFSSARQIDKECADLDRLAGHCAALSARVGELEQDAADLDYLQENAQSVDYIAEYEDGEGETIPTSWQVYDRQGSPVPLTGEYWTNIRAAIRAARSASPSSPRK